MISTDQYVQGSNANLQTSSDVILTYNNNFKKFFLSASVGGNYSYTNSTSLEATAGDLSTPALFTLANAAPGTLSITGGSNTPYNITQGFSAYALATLGYNNQLFLDVTGREDFNGAYAEQKINYFYPSASLSWIASETFHLPEVFSLLKGRLAVADVGNGLLKQKICRYLFI